MTLRKSDILIFYDTIRRYKSHETAINMLTKHYHWKVCKSMSRKKFKQIVEHTIKEEKEKYV